MKLEVPITIEKPVSDVFRFFADDHVRNHPRWDPAMKLELVTPGPIGVGTVIDRRAHRDGRDIEGTMRVIKFERDQLFATVVDDGPMRIEGRATFDAIAPSRTRLTLHVEMPVPDEMAAKVRGSIEQSVTNIKRLIESEPVTPR